MKKPSAIPFAISAEDEMPRRERPVARRVSDRRPGRPTLSNEQLLDKALEIFLEQGFERTSLDAITSAAGMAKRTVYQRYGDKKTLFKEALKRAIDEWILPVDALRAVETEGLEETLLAIGRVLIKNVMSPAGIRLLRITNAEAGRLPEIGAYTYELGTERTIVYLTDLFGRRMTALGYTAKDWRSAAIAYLYLVVCGPPTITAWGMNLDEEAIDRHTRYGVHLLIHGLLEHTDVKRIAETPTQVAAPRLAPEVATSVSELDGECDLASENRLLRQMLIESMLETARLRETVSH